MQMVKIVTHRQWRRAEVYVRQEKRGNAWYRLLYLRTHNPEQDAGLIHFPLYHEAALKEMMEMVVNQALLSDQCSIMHTYQGDCFRWREGTERRTRSAGGATATGG